MGKRETKETYKESKELSEKAEGDYQPLVDEAGERAAGIGAGLGGQRDFLSQGYQKMMEDPKDIVARQISAGNVNFNRVADPRATNVEDLRNSLANYKTFRDTGGLSAENVDRMRGMGGFDEFSKTGGYTPESIANIKAQAISPIGSYATGTREELDRRRAVQGGYAPGFDAANRALQRDSARAIADTSLNANVMLQDRINAGRQWGISGLSAAEGQLAGLQTGNKLAAAAGEAGVSGNLAQLDAADIERIMQTGMFNSRGELDAAIANQQANLAADQYNSQAAAMADAFNIQNQQSQYAAGMAGMGGLYDQDLALQQAEYNRQGQLLNSQYGNQGNFLGTQSDLARQPGWGGNLVGAIGAGAGIASGIMAPGLSAGLGGLNSMNGEWTGNEQVTQGRMRF